MSILSQNLKVGDFVRFKYQAGSNPGSGRTVKIEQIMPDRIVSLDLDKMELRSFKYSKMFLINYLIDEELELAQVKVFIRERPEYSNALLEQFNNRWDRDFLIEDGKVVTKSQKLSATITLDKDYDDVSYITISVDGSEDLCFYEMHQKEAFAILRNRLFRNRI